MDTSPSGPDLADLVEHMRMLLLQASLSPTEDPVSSLPWPRHDDPASVRAHGQSLSELAEASGEPSRRAEYLRLSEEFLRIAESLQAGPRRPDEDELVSRFVTGRIGSRTVCEIMGWSLWDLARACRRHRPASIAPEADQGPQ